MDSIIRRAFSPFAAAWRVIVLALIICATGQAWAVTANVVWESDFGTAVKTGLDGKTYALALPDASWLQGNGTIKIGSNDQSQGATITVTGGVQGEKVSILMEYADATAQSAVVPVYVAAGAWLGSQTKDSSLEVTGHWWNGGGAAYPKSGDTVTTMPKDGYLMYIFAQGDNVEIYSAETLAGMSDASAGGAVSGLNTKDRVVSQIALGGVMIGGDGASLSSRPINEFTGLVIKRVAIFTSKISASEAAAYKFPSEGTKVTVTEANTSWETAFPSWDDSADNSDKTLFIEIQEGASLSKDTALSVAGLVVTGAGSLTLSGAVTASSGITVGSGATVAISGDTGSAITNHGTLNVNGCSVTGTINNYGTIATSGTTSIENASSQFYESGTLSVSGETTLRTANDPNNDAGGLRGRVIINENARLISNYSATPYYSASLTLDLYGELALGSGVRWVVGGGTTVNVYSGGTVTGGDTSNSGLDWRIGGGNINVWASSTFTSGIRSRSGQTITVNFKADGLVFSTPVYGHAGTITKTGNGKLLQRIQNARWGAGSLVANFDGVERYSSTSGGTANGNTETFLNSALTGIFKVTTENGGYVILGWVGNGSFNNPIFAGRPTLWANGDIRIYHATSDKPFTINNLSGTGYLKNGNTAGNDSNVNKYIDTLQTEDTTYSGVFPASDKPVGDPALTVRGEDDGDVHSLTLTGVSTTTGPLVVTNNAKVVFSSTGKWSGGTVTVKDGGVLESQNSAAIAANLKVEEGATLKFADGVQLLATDYDWTSVTTEGSVKVDLSAITPSATPVTLIASGVEVSSDKFTVTASQTPATLSVESGELKATFANVWRNGSWSGETVANQNATLYISQNATLTVSEALSLGAVTVVNEAEEDVTLTVYGDGAFTATSISLPTNVTLKIAKDGEWTVPISGEGAIEIADGTTVTISAAVTTSGGFVVGDNATLTVPYENISSSTGAFCGGATATVEMSLGLGQKEAYKSANPDYVIIKRFGFGDSSSWKGTVEVSGSIGVWPMVLFGNTSSKLVINGLESYIGTYKTSGESNYETGEEGWHNIGTLEIASGGWKVTGGYSNGVMVFPATLTGTGLITFSISGSVRLFFTGDVSEFAGSITIKDTTAADYSYGFGAVTAACQVHMIRTESPTADPRTLANVDYTANAITIAAENEATIGSAATWTAPGGLYVRGTLAFEGVGTFSGNATTYSGASLDYSGSTATSSAITGALTFDRDTALIFSALAGAADYKMAGTLSESVTNTVSLTIGTHAYRAPCGFIATTGKIEFPALATLNGGDTPIAWSSIVWDAKPATIDSNTTVVLNVGGNTTLEVNEAVSIHKFIVNGVANAVLTVLADGGSFVASESVAVKGGVLQQGSASVLGATPLIVVENGATFDFNSYSVYDGSEFRIAGAGAGNWPWALTSSSGAGGAILGGLYLTADATIGGANELKIGQYSGTVAYHCHLQGHTLTKIGVGALTCNNMNTTGTGTIDVHGGAMSVNAYNNLNSLSGDTTVILNSGASLANNTDRVISMGTLKLLGGTLTTTRAFKVKTLFTGSGETAKLDFAAGASASLTGDLTVTSAMTLEGAMAFNKDENAASDVVVTVSGTLSSSSAISVGAGVTLKLGTNRPTGVITVADGGTLAVKQKNATDVIELATSAQPASVVLYDASGEVVSNKRVTYSDGKLTIMLSKPTLEASGAVAFDTDSNWVGSTMPEANGDAIIELLGDAEITVASDYSLGNLTITGSGEVSFSGAGSVSAENIYLKNGAKLSRNANRPETTAINLDSGTVLKLNGVTESAVISGGGSVETYGDVTMAALNTFTGGITAKTGTLSTTTTSGFGRDKSGSGYSELSLITVEDGACVDLNNTKDHCYALTIAGNGVQLVNGTYSGAVKNTGVSMPDSARQTASLTLTADAMVDVSSGWGLVQSSHSTAYLALNGHSLTFRGTGTVPMVNVSASNSSGTMVFDGATLRLSNAASNFTGVNIVVKGCSSIDLSIAPSAIGSLTLKPTTSGTTASAWNLPAGCVPAVDTSNVDHSGLSDGQVLTLFTAPGGTTLTSSTISAQVNGRYTATISGNTVTATFNAGLPTSFLHYCFNEDIAAAADSGTSFNVAGEGGSPSYSDARNGKAVQVHTGYTPYWDIYANRLSPFHEGNVSVTTAAKIGETGVVLWGLGGAAANLAVGLVVTDAHTAKVVARKGTTTVETLATATVTQDLTSGWHFFAIVSDENGTTLYVDHTTASSANGIPTGIGQQGQLGSFHGGAIGASKVGSTGYYLDDWRVYDTKLTAEEVASIRRALVPVGTIFSVY